MIIFIVILCIIPAGFAGRHSIYTGFTVHGVKLKDRSDQILLHQLEHDLDLDVWQHGAPELRDALVMVSPENRVTFFDKLDETNIEHYVHLTDVAGALEEHDAAISRWKFSRSSRMVPFEDYPRYDEVNEYIERIARENPDIVTLLTAGQSFEGRDIKYLKISTSNFTDTSKPVYFLDAMIHAREWVTTPVALYAIHRLVEDLRSEDRDLLENIDWIILPIVNPDGYEYTHTDVRLWRRTRSFNPAVSTTCYGVDGNRNFNVSFNTIGISSNPCSDVYPGDVAFSEPETGYVRDILHEHLERLQLYLNIHSHGNWVLYGFGDASLPPNIAQLHLVGAVMGAAIDVHKLPQAPFYLVGNSNLLLYGTSGSAQDYAQDDNCSNALNVMHGRIKQGLQCITCNEWTVKVLKNYVSRCLSVMDSKTTHIGVPFSYTLELPGLGYDFRVPPQYIEQINAETWYGIAESARLANIFYRSRN